MTSHSLVVLMDSNDAVTLPSEERVQFRAWTLGLMKKPAADEEMVV